MLFRSKDEQEGKRLRRDDDSASDLTWPIIIIERKKEPTWNQRPNRKGAKSASEVTRMSRFVEGGPGATRDVQVIIISS